MIYDQNGEGWKTNLGGTLIGLGTIGAAGNIGSGQLVEGVIGGAILSGIGAALVAADKNYGKKKQSGSGKGRKSNEFDKYFKYVMSHHMKAGKGVSLAGAGKQLSIKKIKEIVKPHLHKEIHISDILGKNWKSKAMKLKKEIKTQVGSGVFDKIGKATKSVSSAAKKKFIQFLDGKTKVKPSTLLDIAAGAVGLAGAVSAFVPGVDLISVPAAGAASLGLKSAAHLTRMSGRGQAGGMDEEMMNLVIKIGDATILAGMLGITVAAATALIKSVKKMRGKGLKLAGQGGSGIFDDGTQWADPEMVPDAARKLVSVLASQSGPVMSKSAVGVAIGLTGAALVGAYALYKKLKKQKGGALKLAGQGGGALKLAGQGLPKEIKEFARKYPAETRKVIEFHKSGKQLGSGVMSKVSKALGVGLPLAKTAYTIYKFLQDHPEIAEKLLELLKAGASKVMTGSGEYPYGIKFTKTGKIKKDRYSVYHGYHQKTASGLTKDDFVLRGKKVMSKKKIEQGKKMAHHLRK